MNISHSLGLFILIIIAEPQSIKVTDYVKLPWSWSNGTNGDDPVVHYNNKKQGRMARCGVILLSFYYCFFYFEFNLYLYTFRHLLLIQPRQFITCCILPGLSGFHQLRRWTELDLIKSYYTNFLMEWWLIKYLILTIFKSVSLPCILHDQKKYLTYIRNVLENGHLTSQDAVVLAVLPWHCVDKLHLCSLPRRRKTVLRWIQSLLLWWSLDSWWIEGALPHDWHSQHRVSQLSFAQFSTS